MRRLNGLVFKSAYILFALLFLVYGFRSWYYNFLGFKEVTKEIFSNLRSDIERQKSLEEMIKLVEANTPPVSNIDNSVPSSERLEFFKNNIAFITDYYFGEVRAYDKSIFIKDSEVIGKVISIDWENQKVKLLVPESINIKEPSEKKTVTFICPENNTYVFYGANVIYDSTLVLENGSLDLTKIVKPGVYTLMSYKDSFYDSEAEWCLIY